MGMPNPFARFNISDDWAAHRARGSLGGTDWATPVGTPIHAPNPGQVTYEYGNGSGGYFISLALANSPGYVMQFLHCSAFEGGNRYVAEGELIGYTGGAKGAPGSGSSDGAHVHVHLVDPNGVREDVLPWFQNTATPAPAPAVSVDYKEVQRLLLDRGFYSGAIDGEFGRQSWTAVQTMCATFGFMDATYIDGVPGKKTYTGMQLYAQKNGNYPGRVDGIVGPLTWGGFMQSLREDAPAKPAPVKPEPVKPAPAKPAPEKPKQRVSMTEPKKLTPVPAKETMSKVDAVKQQEQIASMPAADLGVIIVKASHRKLAYAIYAGVSLLVTNTAVGFAALGTQFPAWLTVCIAVLGNLAVPFASIAIANAPKKGN